MEKVSLGGISFYAESVEYSPNAHLFRDGTLIIRVPRRSDADVKIAALCQAGFRQHSAFVAVSAQGCATGKAYFTGACRPGLYELGTWDFLPIAPPVHAQPRCAPIMVNVTRCECGTGNHTRSSAHSNWCALFTA